MFKSKKRDRPSSEKVSPPHKMTKRSQQQNNQPSNSDLMTQLTQLVATNTDMIQKIENLEKRFSIVEKLFEEVEFLKREVARLSGQNKHNDELKRFEIERKKKSVLVKGLESVTNKKYESRQETYDRVNKMFEHAGLSSLTVEDYQRLGPIKPQETGSTLVRLQFWTKDDKSQLFAKFKEYSNDPFLRKISLISDYPMFQLEEVKKLSNEAYQLRKKDKTVKTRIVPRGLEVCLQTKKGASEKWTVVSPQNEFSK